MSGSEDRASRPGWRQRCASLAINIVYGFAAGIGYAFSKNAMQAFGSDWPGSTAVLLVATSFALAVAIHEVAHALAAQAVGLSVIHGRVFGLEFRRRRHGWSMRWSPRRKQQPVGLVVALPLAELPDRRGFMAYVAAGPLMNLACAAAAVAIAYQIESDAWRYVLFGVAVVHAAPGFASLVPAMDCGYFTDGAALLRWWKGVPHDDPGMRLMRLNGMSIAGIPAEALPETDIALLERAPMPMPFFADWWRLIAARNRADWTAADEVARRFEARFESASAVEREGLSDMMALLRAEAGFCAAMAGAGPDSLDACVLPSHMHWYQPEFRHRIEAARAALRGDEAGCRSALAEYLRQVARNIDAAAVASANALAASIEEALGRSLATPQSGTISASSAAGSPTASTTGVVGV